MNEKIDLLPATWDVAFSHPIRGPALEHGGKRLPMLADLVLQNSATAHAKVKPMKFRFGFETLSSVLRNAKRFVLDEKAAVRFGEVMRDIPDVIAAQQQFARAPYDNMWIEYNAQLVYQTMTGRPSAPDGDARVGFLITDNLVFTFVDAIDRAAKLLHISMMPIIFELHRPWPLDEQLAFVEKIDATRLGLVNWAWGSALSYWLGGAKTWSEADVGKVTAAKTLRDFHTASWIENPGSIARKELQDYIKGSAGDLRNIITLLLLMNQPSIVNTERQIGFSRGFSKGKLRTYLSHNVVSIHVDPRPVLRRLTLGHGSPHRRHDVRGHFCHDKAARDGALRSCDHSWAQDDEDHWHCLVCSGRRWWRKQHQRGDASLGYSTKDYELTK